MSSLWRLARVTSLENYSSPANSFPCNLRSGVPFVFDGSGKERLTIDYLTIRLLLVHNLDFSLIGQETKGYLELSHDWLPV